MAAVAWYKLPALGESGVGGHDSVRSLCMVSRIREDDFATQREEVDGGLEQSGSAQRPTFPPDFSTCACFRHLPDQAAVAQRQGQLLALRLQSKLKIVCHIHDIR